MKAIANTNIRLGLINLPVQIVSATETAKDVTFKLASPDGNPVDQKYVDSLTGTAYGKGECLSGIFDSEGFHEIPQAARDAINERTKLPDMEILEVIDMAEFMAQAHRIDGMYYVQNSISRSAKGNINAFKLFVDALEEEGKALVTKFTLRSRQKLIVLWPNNGILMGSGMAFEGDVREPDEGVRAHLAGQYGEQEMTMAKQLLAALSNDPINALAVQQDDAIPMKHKLVEEALAGQAIEAPEPQEAAQPVDALNAALKAALDATKQAA